MPLGMPSFPWPARPPMPRISPSRTSRETLRTVSPGISTHRFWMDMAILPPAWSSLAAVWTAALCTSRPTIQRVMSSTLVSLAGTSRTTWPSRMTTTWSHTAKISWRRWVMKITEMP